MNSTSESECEENPRRKYLFRDRMVWDARFPAATFKASFRCSAEKAELILQIVGADLTPKYFSNHALDAKEKLLIALRFLWREC